MNTLFLLKKDVKTLSVGLVGLGKSNLAVLKYLKCHFADRTLKLVLRDRRETDAAAWAGTLPEGWTAESMTGGVWNRDGYEDIYFRSPVVRSDCELLVSAQKNGAVVTSETELFFELCPCPVYAVTGSDGKTTTASMTYSVLSGCGSARKSLLGGNIGTPLLCYADDIAPCDRAVAELSSFQLEDFSPISKAAAWLNLTENHLDRHRTMSEYEAAKANILCRTGRAVLCADDSVVARYIKDGDTVWSVQKSENELKRQYGENKLIYLKDGTVCLWDGEKDIPLFDRNEMKVPGRHNLCDAMAAVGLVAEDVSADAIKEGICGFCGVKHRMEYLGVFSGVPCYDSGIDTTPSRTAATLSAMGRRVCVICGGSDKGVSYDLLAVALCRYAHTAVLTGATAQKIYDAVTSCPEYSYAGLQLMECHDFSHATVKAHEEARRHGCALLLSPACASFDAFSGYEERSERFISVLSGI